MEDGFSLSQGPSVVVVLQACFSFCLVASAVYIFNDLLDKEQDARHPQKRHRPIPSGMVSERLAFWLGTLLLTTGLSIAGLAASWPVLLLEAAYWGLNIVYSFYLKRLAILDVLSVAAGFVMRVLAGAFALSVEPSHWLLLCTFLLALFLALGKRGMEPAASDGRPSDQSPAPALYPGDLVKQMSLVVCAATIVSYAIYTVAPDTVANLGADRLVYSVAFVIYGLFRYLVLLQRQETGGCPTDLLLHDRPLLGCLMLWLLYCVYVVYSI